MKLANLQSTQSPIFVGTCKATDLSNEVQPEDGWLYVLLASPCP
ncbi:hypothetical protein LINPERPRIM_LOCUS34181 [Linum perenne]